MTPITVSVIIPTYNRVQLLGEAIASVLAQRAPGVEMEVIVVDNGSSVDVRAPILARFPAVQIVRKEVNTGPAAARRFGVAHAGGRYIAYLDDDDLWLPDKMAAQVDLLEREPTIDWVFTNLRKFDERGDADRDLYDVFPRMREKPACRYAPGELLPVLMSGTPIYLQTIMVRREAQEAIGGWDESIPGCGEDLDFNLRAAHRLNGAFIDRVLVKVRRAHGDNLTANLLRQQIEQQAVIENRLAQYPPDLRGRLRPLMGPFAARVAWMAYQEKDYAAARRLYGRALRYGHITPGGCVKWLMSLKRRNKV